MSSTGIDLYGVNVDLWLESNGKIAPFRDFAGSAVDYIESISVEIGLMENIRTEVKLCPPVDVGIKLLQSGICGMGFSVQKTDSTKTAQPVGETVNKQSTQVSLNKMMLRISYQSEDSPWFKTYLMQPEFSLGDEGMEITLHGFGILFDQTKRSANFPGQITAFEAVNLILDGKNITPIFEDKAKQDLMDESTRGSYISKKNQLEYLREILTKYSCKFVYIGSNGSQPGNVNKIKIIHTEETRKASEVQATFVAFKDIDPQNRIYPILTMNAPLTNVLIGSTLAKIKHNSFSRETGKPVNNPLDYKKDVTPNIVTPDKSTASGGDDKTTSNQQGESSGPDTSNDLFGSIMGTIERGGSDMVNKMKGIVHDWMDKAFEFNGTSVLIPKLLPGKLVKINVADIQALNNSFDLHKVRHTISNGGAETSFELKAMAGTTSAIGQGLNKVVGKVVNTTQGALGQQPTKTPTSQGLAN